MKFKLSIFTYKRCLLSRRGDKKFRNQKNPEKKIIRRKSKGNFIRENLLHKKKKSFIKSLCKFDKRKKKLLYVFFAIQ